MDTPPALELPELFDLLEIEDTALSATVADLTDADLAEPSLCAGWTRAHVLAHLAHNADALRRLVHWSTTGEHTPAYASPEARDRDIEDGEARSAGELRSDLARSSAEFADAAQALRGRDDLVDVRTGSTSMPLPGARIPWARVREVAYHHADLQAGYGFAHASPAVLEHGLHEAMARMEAAADRPGAPEPPGVTVSTTEGDRWQLGDGSQYVSGDRAAVLGWLARGLTDGLHHEEPLPALPPWG